MIAIWLIIHNKLRAGKKVIGNQSLNLLIVY